MMITWTLLSFEFWGGRTGAVTTRFARLKSAIASKVDKGGGSLFRLKRFVLHLCQPLTTSFYHPFTFASVQDPNKQTSEVHRAPCSCASYADPMREATSQAQLASEALHNPHQRLMSHRAGASPHAHAAIAPSYLQTISDLTKLEIRVSAFNVQRKFIYFFLQVFKLLR